MSLVSLVMVLFQIYSFLLIAKIILSWVPHDPYHPIVKFISQLTDPYLDLFRQLPLNFGGLDLSPIVAFFVLDLIRNLLMRVLVF